MWAAVEFLLGRVTFEVWAAFWPTQSAEENPMAALINSKEKYVGSITLVRSLLAGSPFARRRRLRR
jgi:hypothetical protein